MTPRLAAYIATGAAVVAVMLLAYLTVVVTRTLRQMERTLQEVRTEAVPFLKESTVAMRQANEELERMGGFIETAESVGETVDAASKLAYTALSNPVIKALALGAGVARGARTLRGKK